MSKREVQVSGGGCIGGLVVLIAVVVLIGVLIRAAQWAF